MYKILVLPLISALVAQSVKFFIRSNKQKLSLKGLIAYSGMPSGHTAMVISLSTIIGLQHGFSSTFFAFSIIFAIIIIRDAVGLRRYLGYHGKTLNKLVEDLDADSFLDEKYPKLLEKIGHTPLQVLIGAIIGLAISLIGYYIF